MSELNSLEQAKKRQKSDLITFESHSFSLGKQRPVLCHVEETPIPEKGNEQQNDEQSGTATPDPEDGAGSSGFVAVNFSPVPQEVNSQEWVMLELEQASGSGGGKPPTDARPENKPGACGTADTENPSSELQDGPTGPAVPSSPVLSQLAVPGTWLLGHRRLPGMLGQMPSVMMGRSQTEQVGQQESRFSVKPLRNTEPGYGCTNSSFLVDL